MKTVITRAKATLRPIYYAVFRKGKPAFTNRLADMKKYDVGEWTYGSPTVLDWGQGSSLTIGRFCSIAGGVQIFLGGDHRHELVTTYPFTRVFKDVEWITQDVVSTKGDVVIGNDVWVGHESVILSGVTIGNGAVIGARSVVTRDIPPFAVAVGSPARVVKFRFDADTISALEELAWWNWPVDKIRAALPLLLSSDVAAFLKSSGRSS